jgi:hypothetical protein
MDSISTEINITSPIEKIDTPCDDYTQRLEEATYEWLARQDRSKHPEGSFDNKRRWYPDSAERQSCCNSIREPSAAYPYSLMLHCRTVRHLALRYNVRLADLQRRAKEIRPPVREGGNDYYKAVAVVDERYLSIYDGQTEYRFGETTSSRPRQEHGGGIYVYPTYQQAMNASVPSTSALLDAPRAILRVKADGAYCRYDNGKLAFARVTPIEVATTQ